MTITEKERFMKYRIDAVEKRLDMIESLLMQQHVSHIAQPSQVPQHVGQPVQALQATLAINAADALPVVDAVQVPRQDELADPMSIVRRRFIL